MPPPPDDSFLDEVIEVHELPTARSYGSVNAEVSRSILRMARDWGVLTDPIYMGKTLMSVEAVVKSMAEEVSGTSEDVFDVAVHSGGGMGLFGRGAEVLKKCDWGGWMGDAWQDSEVKA